MLASNEFRLAQLFCWLSYPTNSFILVFSIYSDTAGSLSSFSRQSSAPRGVLGGFVSFKPASEQSLESIELNVWMSRLPFDVAHRLFIYRKGSVSFDVDIITNSEHVSMSDNDMKLCVQRMQHETKGSSNYDIMTTDYYLVLTYSRFLISITFMVFLISESFLIYIWIIPIWFIFRNVYKTALQLCIHSTSIGLHSDTVLLYCTVQTCFSIAATYTTT